MFLQQKTTLISQNYFQMIHQNFKNYLIFSAQFKKIFNKPGTFELPQVRINKMGSRRWLITVNADRIVTTFRPFLSIVTTITKRTLIPKLLWKTNMNIFQYYGILNMTRTITFQRFKVLAQLTSATLEVEHLASRKYVPTASTFTGDTSSQPSTRTISWWISSEFSLKIWLFERKSSHK